jgi:hypothetical protein
MSKIRKTGIRQTCLATHGDIDFHVKAILGYNKFVLFLRVCQFWQLPLAMVVSSLSKEMFHHISMLQARHGRPLPQPTTGNCLR